MDIKDYLPYYIGQKMIRASHWEPQNDTYILTGRNLAEAIEFGDLPLLRRLEHMTEEEVKAMIGWEKMNVLYTDLRYKKLADCINIEYNIDTGDEGCYPQFHSISFLNPTPQQFHYLLKQGFDIFGLIDASLAIDSKSINK